MKNTPKSLCLCAIAVCTPLHAQTTTFWDGGTSGNGTSWATSTNWSLDALPPNAADSNVVINNRNGTPPVSISTLTISANRTLGTVTFDNVNNVLASNLNVDTNGSGTTNRTLALHGGITLQNTSTTVTFRGNNGVLTIDLAADNVFSTSVDSRLRINEEVPIIGVGKLTKTGPGTVFLEGTNSYSGGTAVDSGTLQLGRSEVMGSGNVTLGSSGGGDASIIAIYAGFTHSNNIELIAGSGGLLTLGATSSASFSTTFAGDITLNDDLTLLSDSATGFAMRLTGSLSGAGNLTKTGTGTVRIEDDNVGFTGNTTISAGTLQLGSFSGNTSGSLGAGDIINNAELRININSNTTLSNTLSGTGILTHSGTGTTSINNASNSYSGDTLITAGTLRIGTSGSLGNGGVTVRLGGTGSDDASLLSYLGGWAHANDIEVVAGTGGTRTLGLTSTFTGNTTYSGNVTLNTGLTVDSAAPDGNALRLTGIVSGSGSLTTQGAGTTELSGANTHTGGTSVITGTLLVSNTTGSATGTGVVMTSASTILGGNGRITPTGGNSVTIGGNASPGEFGTIGTLSFLPENGNVVFQSGSGMTFQLLSNGISDRIDFAASGSGLLDLTAMGSGSLSVIFDPAYTPMLNDSFDLLNWSAAVGSGIQGIDPSLLSLDRTGFDPSWDWDLSAFTSSGVITVGLIPEPSRLLLAGLGFSAMLMRRRRPTC